MSLDGANQSQLLFELDKDLYVFRNQNDQEE